MLNCSKKPGPWPYTLRKVYQMDSRTSAKLDCKNLHPIESINWIATIDIFVENLINEINYGYLSAINTTCQTFTLAHNPRDEAWLTMCNVLTRFQMKPLFNIVMLKSFFVLLSYCLKEHIHIALHAFGLYVENGVCLCNAGVKMTEQIIKVTQKDLFYRTWRTCIKWSIYQECCAKRWYKGRSK